MQSNLAFATIDDKHTKHAFSHEWIKNFLFNKFGYDVWDMPMCACERIAFWHTGETSMCPHCMRNLKNPITVGEYYRQKLHKSSVKGGVRI